MATGVAVHVPTTAVGIDPSQRQPPKAIPTLAQNHDLQAYLERISLRTTPIQDELQKVVEEHPIGIMSGARDESQFLAWLVSLIKAKKVIEIGVFLGSTTLAIAQALPNDGKVLALDVSEEFTSVGKKFWVAAGQDHKIDLRLKPALETLNALAENTAELGTYDLAFLDADKVNYDSYYELALKLVRPGGIIAVDNVLWFGSVLAKTPPDQETVVICALNEKIRNDKRVDITTLPLADGVTLCRKL